MEKIQKFKSSLSLKLFVVGFLVFILMIPTAMIAILVNERENRQSDAILEVSEKWGRKQMITGPILTVPYKKIYESMVDGNKKRDEVIRYAHFLPESLMVNGEILPETRQRGIYEVVVYNADLNINGEFNVPDFSKWEINPEMVMYDKAFLSLGIPDLRGVKENISLKWNNDELSFIPGIETNDILSSGVSAGVYIDPNDKIKYKYELNLVLNGSRDLEFVPIGRTTEVRLASTWTDPSFQGSFLPNKYNLNENGFSADWKILEINRNFPQSFLGTMTLDEGTNTAFNKYEEAIQVGGVQSSSFGVRLLVVADEYQKTVRALKYAIMILSLTFLILFFFEAINKKRVHALQYILIGLALSLFYVLLLSIAEHLGFDLAYWISVVATLGLIMFYSKSVFAAWRPAMIESLILFFIYSFIFVILQLKDYALLVGSVGLFVILAVVMYVSRKIDWYNLSEK
ncbi:hypothetical protein A2331_00185 [Candidatus Falkowbacteria bacterium RIFOXYB2_FULL_34_18]|uniref:Cell envelope integrity protein CreD n=1 Tax=Candidatus Falkowbacteria bacterium RIFOXYD2_FULL_34_120 TaxID=1798007 RepID=A0A1F5TS43_9BACT|nr:MAG: hypothetical protein A2331_00185 [Candidatus Falkowbacteria bacterium RIFOXYB2_FULL_34_18]OGF29758.1 MAG: hypothetical protein A2500_01165 [Candidatus Falkowbacteria bacterium RIFOXYC12_FULL_34_55]OGF37513.1 MAG: hypothetical protein A2466_00745 [Candidatus Falkowbacteria bacterium RIFOXYC2_FULL_34_220]OGF39223.1 MAG: hypothetical protein A2515_01255 [Candidatus Falkowbacteria bacterium RIFOXYD12_FULL_34_57]OGF41790.1 MAG: hypothetical protein A2531_05915 [Candidatus Falkowbacteria bact